MMNEIEFHQNLLFWWIGLALVLIPVLLFIPAPYGKFASNSWGWKVSGKWGWFIQECISPLVLVYAFFYSPPSGGPWDLGGYWGISVDVSLPATRRYLLIGLWCFHYLNRSVIYTLRAPEMNHTSIWVVLMAIVFNLINGYVNGAALSDRFNPIQSLQPSFISDARFYVGLCLFLYGMYINISSDEHLMSLRRRRSTGQRYFIPEAGWFQHVSCANYFGEILEWTGFAMMTDWSLAAVSFMVWTAANLIPRAIKAREWYRKTFKTRYPASRKAVIPGIL